MKATIQKLARIALVFGIGSCLMATTSLAQKSGGSATGGGTGGGGGGGVTTTTVIVPMFGTYYGVGGSGSTVATGSVTLTFDATQTLRSMTLTAGNVHMPDGTIMHCVMSSNGLTQPTFYYPINVPQLVGDLHLSAGQATISGTTANGDNVPLFGTFGTIFVDAVNPVTGQNLGRVLTGSYNLTALKGGGNGGGHP